MRGTAVLVHDFMFVFQLSIAVKLFILSSVEKLFKFIKQPFFEFFIDVK